MEIDRNIGAFLHCAECLKVWKAGEAPDESPKTFARLGVGFTALGVQVVCNRHDLNVIHIDFEGQTHPSDQSQAGDFGGTFEARVQARLDAKQARETLTHGNPESWLETIWAGLESHRENCIPEGEPEYDSQWDEICTAMAWLTEALGLPTGADAEAD